MITKRSLRVRQSLWALLVLASLIVSLFVLWQLRGDLRPLSRPADSGEAAYAP